MAPNSENDADAEFVTHQHPFVAALRDGELDRVKSLLRDHPQIANARIRGDFSLTGKIWKDGNCIPVKETNSDCVTALQFAAFHGLKELAKILIESGADIEVEGDLQQKPISAVYVAAWQGNKETLEVLLASAKTRGIQLDLLPALSTALVHLSHEKAKLLHEYGAEHNIYTAAMAGNGEVLKQLIAAAPESIEKIHPNYGRTPLEQALKVGQVAMAEILADHGAKIEPQSAAAMGKLEEVKALLDSDEKAAASSFGNYPLLTWAINGGQVEVVQLLLDRGANPNCEDNWGVSALRYAAQVEGARGARIVDLLVSAGANVDYISRGYTALAVAVENANHDVIQALRSHGAQGPDSQQETDPSEPSQEQRDRLKEAIVSNDIEIVERLVTDHPTLTNLDLRKRDERNVFSDGHPLHIACEQNHSEIASLLLKRGADANAPGADPNDRPVHGMPLHLSAAEFRNYELANLLLDYGATPNSYPNCDKATIERMFYHARESAMPEALVRRAFASFLPKSELSKKKPTELLGENADAAIRLFARMVTLGAQPPFAALVREGFDELLFEIIEHCHGEADAPNDHQNAHVLNRIQGASRWYGYPQLVRRLMEHHTYQYTYEDAISTIGTAIGSHNRDGDYADYREIIVLQLEALERNNEIELAQEDPEFQPLYQVATDFTWHSNYGYRAAIAKPECYIDLAELLMEWGIGEVEYRDPENGDSPLTAAVKRGHHPGITTFIEWLLEKGADLRQSDTKEVNPIAIAKEKGHGVILKLLESEAKKRSA